MVAKKVALVQRIRSEEAFPPKKNGQLEDKFSERKFSLYDFAVKFSPQVLIRRK